MDVGTACPVEADGAMPRRNLWTRIGISRVEELSDAVLGAGLDAMQMSRTPVTGSLAFAERDGLVFSSGNLGGRVALLGPLSEQRITLGVGLHLPPGSRHWLGEVVTGNVGVFRPSDMHDALYVAGSLYVTVTLSGERLEEIAARAGLVLDACTLGGTGIHPRPVDGDRLRSLRRGFEQLHAGGWEHPWPQRALTDDLLDLLLTHFGRPPRPVTGGVNPRGYARIVARARAYVLENLEYPVSIDAMAAAAYTSHRTLHRAFNVVLDETPQSFVRKLRLHRIRQDLASEAEAACTVALIANRWGIGELGRLAGWYRELFGELPHETLAASRRSLRIAPDARTRLAGSA